MISLLLLLQLPLLLVFFFFSFKRIIKNIYKNGHTGTISDRSFIPLPVRSHQDYQTGTACLQTLTINDRTTLLKETDSGRYKRHKRDSWTALSSSFQGRETERYEKRKEELRTVVSSSLGRKTEKY